MSLSPVTHNQIIQIFSQHPLHPTILFEEEPAPEQPTLMLLLREKSNGEVEAIFYPGFFQIPPVEQHKFLNKALKQLDELYQKWSMVQMAQNLLQMEHNVDTKTKPEIDPSLFDAHHDDSNPLGVESPAAPLPSLEDLLRENQQQFKEAVDSLRELQSKDPNKVLLMRNFNIHKNMALEILESFIGLSLDRLSSEVVSQVTEHAVHYIRKMAYFHYQLINLAQQDQAEQDQT